MKKFMKTKAMNSPSKSQFFTPTTLGGMSVKYTPSTGSSSDTKQVNNILNLQKSLFIM